MLTKNKSTTNQTKPSSQNSIIVLNSLTDEENSTPSQTETFEYNETPSSVGETLQNAQNRMEITELTVSQNSQKQSQTGRNESMELPIIIIESNEVEEDTHKPEKLLEIAAADLPTEEVISAPKILETDQYAEGWSYGSKKMEYARNRRGRGSEFHTMSYSSLSSFAKSREAGGDSCGTLVRKNMMVSRFNLNSDENASKSGFCVTNSLNVKMSYSGLFSISEDRGTVSERLCQMNPVHETRGFKNKFLMSAKTC